MTSTAPQQDPNSAANTSATTASYASAAGAPQKPTQTQPPVVATGSQPPVAASSASSAQNAKSASPTPVNGKTTAPAVSNVNRGVHSRHSSVTMAANGPNSYAANGGPAGAAKSGIQFGFGSPAATHSSPQTGNAAPIPIPGGNARVPSPAHSPSPIPQPSASGGRPPSGLQNASGQMTFGSLGSDGERHMRQGSIPSNPSAMGAQQPGAHFRRESNHSIQSDGHGRGNFAPQGGRGGGRGGYNHHNNYNHQMGYPPNNQFRNGPGGQGRGMPPSFQPQGPRNMGGYPNSPQPNHRSPAMVPSMPTTPNMPPSAMHNPMPQMGQNMGGQNPAYHYGPPMPGQPQQVQSPFISTTQCKPSFKTPKKTKSRRDSDRSSHMSGRSEAARELNYSNNSNNNNNGRFSHRRNFRRLDRDRGWSENEVQQPPPVPEDRWEKSPPDQLPPQEMPPSEPISIDMSPGNYEQLLLTMKRQGYGYPPQQMDQYGRPYGYGVPYMHPPQANSPGYNQGFAPPQYHHQSSHSMSRTPSQPERPPSANQHGPPVAVGSNTKQQTTPSQSGSDVFAKPRKSAAIQIKTASGEVLDTSSFKVPPASPAPSSQQAKTPPVASSNPTPPPKPSTPSHSRTDSSAAQKTRKEIQDELKEKIKQATQAKEGSSPASQAETEATTESKEKPETESKAPAAPTKSAEEPAEDKPAEETKKPEPKKPEPEKPAEPAKNDEPDEDEMERIIREMEEEDARREKEEEEHRIRREKEKAEQKKKDEENRKANAADEDRKLREQEREMERLEEEKEKKRQQGGGLSVAEALAGRTEPAKEEPKVDNVTDKLASMKIGGEKSANDGKPTTAEKRGKPAALNLAPLKTNPVEPPQPSAALQSLKSARFLTVMGQDVYPAGVSSPNPALNAAVSKKGKTFKYDSNFLLQFQKVFTEQPSLEFHQQVKSLIGDGDGNRSARGAQTPGSARQGSRGGGAGFQMGTFNPPPGGRTLPSGTTSADRFAMSSGTLPRPQVNPMNSFQRPGGAFPMGSSMSRTSSQSNMGNSGRQGSRSTRGSRRNDTGAKEAQAAKTMPLTAGQEVKPIAVTSSGWKPTSVGRGAAAAGSKDGHMDPEMVQRKVKAALNKMTPENFERISEQILVIASQSKDESDGRTLRQVIQLTFEKATDESHWASMYAKFCKKMLETMSPEIQDERIKDKNGNVVSGGNLFRKYLLNRCQEEFERGWKTDLPEPKEGEGENKKPGEVEMLSDEYYKAAAAKRRGLGLVQFIGELYKLGMLTERIMLECVHKLVDYKGVPDEAEIESLSKLLRTIGQNLDMSEKGRPMMDVYFSRIQQMIDMPELPSRMKFMLMDVVDLRKANWVSKETNKGPKTLEEVRAEAEAAQAAKAQESARNNQRGGGRPPAGRGDARNFSAGYQQQQSNQVGMDDLRRLKGTANRSSSGNVTLGPTSMFSSRSNSGRRLGPGGALGRQGEDSGGSSRTGTPPVKDNSSHSNAFSLLANMETEHPASPPSTSASPNMTKAVPDSEKKDGE